MRLSSDRVSCKMNVIWFPLPNTRKIGIEARLEIYHGASLCKLEMKQEPTSVHNRITPHHTFNVKKKVLAS